MRPIIRRPLPGILATIAALTAPSLFARDADPSAAQRLAEKWDRQRAEVVNGHAKLTHFFHVSLTPSASPEDVHKALHLDEDFGPDTLVAGQPPSGLTPSAIGPGPWGESIEMFFEANRLKNIIVQTMPDKREWTRILTFDGTQLIAFDSNNNQATIYPGNTGLVTYGLGKIRYVPDVAPDVIKVLSSVKGGQATVSAYGRDITADADGLVRHASTRDPKGLVAVETFQFGSVRLNDSITLPKVRIDISYADGKARIVDAMRLEQCELNVELPSTAFTPGAPTQPIVLDLRSGEREVIGDRGTTPVEDVLRYAKERKLPATTPPSRSPWTLVMQLNTALVGCLLIALATRLLRSRPAAKQ